MADADKTTLEKIGKLTVLLRELQAKEYAVVEEMQALLGGKAGVGEVLKRLQKAFDAAWCSRYAVGTTGRYVWQWARDLASMKRLLKALTAEQLEARFLVYVRNDDPFFTKNRHTFGLFVSSVNQWAPEAESTLTLNAPVHDCRHTPSCVSDIMHTAKRDAEMRGSAF